MSLSSALYNSLTSLRSTQTGIDTLSRNVANAGTPGYTRKTSPQEAVVLQGQGAGVRRLAVEREIDLRVQRELRVEHAGNARLEVVHDFLSRIDQLLGRPDEEASFASSVKRLTTSFQALADKPESTTLRRAAVDAADVLAGDLNDLSDAVQAMRQEADAAIADAVATVNESLESIRALNDKISVRKQTGRSAADLEDQRDQHLDAVARLMDVRYFQRGSGEVVIMTTTGRTLLDETVRELRFDGRSVITPQAQYDTDPALRGVGTITLVEAGAEVDLLARDEIRSGEIAGLVELRDTMLVQAQDQLDELAHHLALSMAAGEIAGTPVQSVAVTEDFDAAAWPLVGSVDTGGAATIDIDGSQIVLANIAVTGATVAERGAAMAANIEQALVDNGLTGITVTFNDDGAGTETLTFTDVEGRTISGFEITDGVDTAPAGAPAMTSAERSTTLDVQGVTRPGDTVTLTYVTTAGQTATVTLTAVEAPATEPNTFALGATQALTAQVVETALAGQLPAGFTVTRDGTALTVADTDLAVGTPGLVSLNGTTQTGNGLQLDLFADGEGSLQEPYTGLLPGDETDPKLGLAQRIAVNSGVVADPSLLVRYALDDSGTAFADEGDPARPLELLRRLSETARSFDSGLGLGPVTTTLEGFAIEIVAFQGIQTARAGDELDYQTAVTEAVERRFDDVSGVNVDEEMTELLLLEQIYTASSQVLNAVDRMFDELFQALR